VEDFAAISEAMDERYRPMVWLGAMLGLRSGEVAGLTVGSLDLLRNSVTVTRQLGRDRTLAEPKSYAGRRQFSVPGELSDLLAAHMVANDLTGAEPDLLLLTTCNRAPLDYSHWPIRVWVPAHHQKAIAPRPQRSVGSSSRDRAR
jgi:hypothetical protein